MPGRRIGQQTIAFEHQPRMIASASVAGPKEGRGPFGAQFDLVLDDPLFQQDSYEQAEQAIFQSACRRCIEKAGISIENIQAMLGGDLLNQIMSASLAARALSIPFLGLYGA